MILQLDHQLPCFRSLRPGDLLHRFPASVFPISGHEAGILMQKSQNRHLAEQTAKGGQFKILIRERGSADDFASTLGRAYNGAQAEVISGLQIDPADLMDAPVFIGKPDPAGYPSVRRKEELPIYIHAGEVLKDVVLFPLLRLSDDHLSVKIHGQRRVHDRQERGV